MKPCAAADGLVRRQPLTSGPKRRRSMETFDGTVNEARATGRRINRDLSDGAGNIKNAASAEIKSLIADVEDLVARIADLNDADVARVRNKVMRAVDTAKESQAQRAATTADDYVRDSPWQAVGIAALVGAVVGILATRRS